MVQPYIGHLTQALNIFKYLEVSPINGWLVSDPYDFDIDWAPLRIDESPPQEQSKAITHIYPDTFNEFPHRMPTPLGQGCFVDADHAGNQITN